jgi:hypothetical protein
VPVLSEEQLQDLVKRAVSETLDQRDRIDHERHKDDHEWITLQREKCRKREARWEKFRASMVGAIAVAVVGGTIKFLVYIGELVLAAKTGGK